MVVNKPPMGWNSWNTFGRNIDEKLIMDTADKMVSEGLLDAGYEYLVIDDIWSLKERQNGKLVADPEKFPHGMKYVADYVHSKGLKFGMYSCAGTLTCAGFPGSYDHEFVDAATFAEWGVDFLKYDYCNHSDIISGAVLYRRMATALENCGRDILFSACSWGADETHKWIKTTGADMWRSTGDIFDTWESIRKLTEAQYTLFETNGRGCFNDMDMLVVGMNGKGNVGIKGCTFEEYKAHFSIWAMFGSPLMIGCDIRDMDEDTKTILLNKDVIAIDQDATHAQPFSIRNFAWSADTKIFVKLLDGGDMAIAMINFSDQSASLRFSTDEVGLSFGTGKTLEMKELWSGEVSRPKNETFTANVPAHGVKLYRAKVVDLDV